MLRTAEEAQSGYLATGSNALCYPLPSAAAMGSSPKDKSTVSKALTVARSWIHQWSG
jgi:hypothetical protein